MKYKSFISSNMKGQKMRKANINLFVFVFILAISFFAFNFEKISAMGTEIIGTMFDKNSDGEITQSDVVVDGQVTTKAENFLKVDLTSGTKKLTFIQGNGQNDKVAIKFTISDFPSDVTSFMIVESERTDSSSLADADRYNKDSVTGAWVASNKNVAKNGITGSVLFSTGEDGKITVDVVYRLRKGTFGMKFLKIYCYKAEVSESNPTYQHDVAYVIAQPIDMVNQSSDTCTEKNAAEICVNYDEDGATSRISKELKIYLPVSVAYNFKTVDVSWTYDATINNEVVNNYNAIVNGSTIYGINYFNEAANGEVTPTTDKANAQRSYMYTNFVLSGVDSNGKTNEFVTTYNSNYTLCLDTFTANEIDYISTKVDAIGAYIYFIKDIFGNVKEIVQEVTNVKNRAIIVEVQKSNADDAGYGAEETFTNESVKVELTMTVETHYEFGVCLDKKCTEVINLTKDDVKQVKYWRVNVVVDDGYDRDAYQEGDLASKDYAHEDYAASGSMRNIYCKTASYCTDAQVFDPTKINKEDGFGFHSFDGNVLAMYIGVNGRYRYYVEDIYGNNSWGVDADRLEEEYRNPRVEVYAIDKSAPEITFEVDNTDTGSGFKTFDVQTYEYYMALELAIANGAFEYDARITDTTEAVEKVIENSIYYPLNRDGGRSGDDKFTDQDSLVMSKVRASEYIYYYDGSKDLYSDYSVYDRETNQYVVKLYGSEGYDNSINTIANNTKHNSNGLELAANGSFSFSEINYYHNTYGASDKTLVCDQIASISGYESYATKNKLDCVNYYIDHGVDFVIEFVAKDYVGNVGKGYVYVNLIDTTPPGFTLHTTIKDGQTVTDRSKLVKASNIGTDCRMEIGQEIGSGKTQDMADILNCYNVDLTPTVDNSNKYNFEDNVYSNTVNDGLSFYNRINDINHVKLYMLSDRKNGDGDYIWVDLGEETFIPNKTGYYDLKIVIYDNAIDAEGTNSLTILVSYYVDRKIVLIEPIASNKVYGVIDPGFDYCVYIDEGNHADIRFSNNPYSDPTIFTKIYCTNQSAEEIAVGKTKLFQQNINSDFYGDLSRLESVWYNASLTSPIYITGTSVGVENNYVGLYRIVLGTLNIKLNIDEETADDDYIVKIHPTYRDNTKYSNTGNEEEDDNLITNAILEDDDKFSQSNVDFTIKQAILNVMASGGNKNYGDPDTNASNYNDDSASNKYLNGFKANAVEGLINDNIQYKDTTDIILGVLRRETGENVGLYKICNYRGLSKDDNALENAGTGYNNMYLNCIDTTRPGVSFNESVDDFSGYTYSNGRLIVNADFVKSRALYIETNKRIAGRTLNVTTDLRNNTYSNYVINYTEGDYIINAIDLVLQAAPGQRREYNYTNTYDPNPWEIILYGLVDGAIKRVDEDGENVVAFNGYTADVIEGDYYGAESNEKDTENGSEASKIPANYSEERTNWYLYHNNIRLEGYKTNDTYKLLRNTSSGSAAGSSKLVRESGKDGGWYLYYSLGKDLNVVTGTASVDQSNIAVITNGREQCSYDETGHIVSVDGEVLCKNYNLIYNPYYTNEDGYTIANHPENVNDSEFVYKSNGKSCLTLDPDLPCKNTATDNLRIYKIQFEIYRREIILEFNSAIETIDLSNASKYNIFYGKRYNFYKNNYFDIGFYDVYNAKLENTTKLYPEDYLFLCYQNETSMARAEFDTANPASTGCTGNYKYGLTAGDSWANLGIYFKLHEAVSSSNSDYYDDEDYAIPAGVYYVYSDIAEAQKKNYNYKYLGGSLTIKSLSVEVEITSYVKEYGEKYYSKYGLGADYSSFATFDSCLLDGWFINSNTNLINLGENVYCTDSDVDFENSENNIYGFHINGLDSKDTIADNFNGRPNRSRSVSLAADTNGLQDNVGTYIMKQGTISTINNNPFINATNACENQVVKGDYGSCVVVSGKPINNYVIFGETRTYTFDMHTTVEEEKDVDVATPGSVTIQGSLFIVPAQITITVTAGQTKMYGCAYNAVNTSNASTTYSYSTGYSNCVESDNNYYDLGYEYTVIGDKDYQIARNGYDYTSDDSYKVSGIKTADTFRPSTVSSGIKAHALNDGTLYRIPDTTENRAKVKMSSYVNAAFNSQEARGGGEKTYQGQTVGNYIITLGNVDATDNAEIADKYKNLCNANNMPGVGADYTFTCKNYDIDYYGTKVYEDSVDVDQTYTTGSAFPTDILFTITKRTAYVYTNYDQKIYGEADMYNDSTKSVVYLCGDNDMDGDVDEDDDVTLEGGDVINKDVYYGFCSKEQVDNNKGTDGTKYTYVEYGLTRYYTKYNSLAKAPWNGITGRNDVQTDILAGKLSRKGMGGNAPTTDDIRGFYEYVYEKEDFYGTVHLIGSIEDDEDDYGSSYGYDNYFVNYYENGLAVNKDGLNVENDEDETPIKFEIVLRQIKVAFVSFDKVYGEKDVVTDYNILVCAPSEDFDFVNMKCINKSPTDKHGLSATHTREYLSGGILNQSQFKNDFVVRFMRVLGENVSCGTASNVSVSLSGYFFGDASEVSDEGLLYKTTLSCNLITLKDANNQDYSKSVYETLAYLDQEATTVPGYNYQINYTTGYVNIIPRTILITPDAGQGFEYGDYHDTLIPTITFKDSLVKVTGETTIQTYGLVHGAEQAGVCLNNINYYNNGTIDGVDVGTCFYVNDRMDEYSSNNSISLSKYDSTIVNPNTGLSSLNVKNYVFGDNYQTESSVRSALDRKISTNNSTRYNRNVGVYTITLGDLKDQTGNYTITFKDGVTYEIKAADTLVTPDSSSKENVSGTTQTGQYKIYGEQDKELTFTVQTTYTVTYTHYAKYNSNIVNVTSSAGVTTPLANLDRFSYSTESKSFSKVSDGDHIYLVAGDVVTLNGFAYSENNGDIRNYGKGQSGLKNNVEQKVNQASITDSLYYDIVCKDAVEGCNANRTLSYGETSRILLGYLYVDNWAQAAGVYNIVNGFKVAVNEWDNVNYNLSFTTGVKFTIIPRPIGVQIENITKTYGQTTDVISCEYVSGAMISPCSVEDGVLLSGNTLLRDNFTVEYFSGTTNVESIINGYVYDGGTYDNSKLYSQNGRFANGLVPERQKAYSQYGAAESKSNYHLGVYVSRDERNTTNGVCLYSGDTYGFCEDAGTYYLRMYGYLNTIDNITTNNYQSVFKPITPSYTGEASGVEKYYYNSYFGHNPNYFVVVLDNDAGESAVTPDELFSTSHSSTSRTTNSGKDYDKLLKATGTLTINKKNVALYVNTTYFEEGREIYYVGQNTSAPAIPSINNDYNLNYNQFNGIGAYTEADRKNAVSGVNTYGMALWGTHPAQVRLGDKLVGELAYCNTIISEADYNALKTNGISSDYSCGELIYNADKSNVDTNLIGFVPIVRNSDALSIVSQTATAANKGYEQNNYAVKFYPGALRIEDDDIKPVVEVNKKDVYLEANAVGTYMYECVGVNKSTTYSQDDCSGISIVGKTANVEGDPILDWLMESTANYSTIIKANLPLILGCESATDQDCTSSAYFELTNGKGNSDFKGIKAGEESSIVSPFTMYNSDLIKNGGPNNLKEMIITLVSWFGVTAYDQGEIRSGQILEKKFDQYWYIVIEEQGTNGKFDISKVGQYKVHFYVMDNAGNVSEGNMYEEVDHKNVLQDDYKNVGTLHIIDTTDPIVGTLNLYNGRVECVESDCTKEENWIVYEDTYLPYTTFLRYDSEGNPDGEGTYIDIGSSGLVNISSLKKYSQVQLATGGYSYQEDNDQGKYILIAKGNKASGLKHYSWSNSTTGIYLTITGGSDNSYTETLFPTKNVKDYSQWNHYYSRDGGITWFLYDKTKGASYLALDSEGTREILIKAVDSGVKLTGAVQNTVSYTTKYYGSGSSSNAVATMNVYTFTDTVEYDEYLKTFNNMTSEEQAANDAQRNTAMANVGWNVSIAAENDSIKAETLSQLLYGVPAEGIEGASGYKFYRDKQTAYLDRTRPIIKFGDFNGEKLYVYEFGCSFCTVGYDEKYAGAIDSYPESYTSSEILSSAFEKNHSILINHVMFESTKTQEGTLYQTGYLNITQEKPGVKSDNGGLGSDVYAMNGKKNGLDIRNVYMEERRYIIYSFDKNDVRTTYDLSKLIPTTDDETIAGYEELESSIYDVIKKDPAAYTTLGDYTYTIIYSVFDKAGNESVYIARGVIYADLVPEIAPVSPAGNIEPTGVNSYSLRVEQGQDVNEIVESLKISATNNSQFLTQTIYYNGELVVDNDSYQQNIYDGFTTSVPGVYEITYNLQYMYYGSDGQKELIEAKPITLTITIEATPPIVEANENINFSYIIVLVGLLIASVGVCWFGFYKRKRV